MREPPPVRRESTPISGRCVVDRPRPRRELDTSRIVEARAEHRLERVAPVVGVGALALPRRAAVRPSVVSVGELDTSSLPSPASQSTSSRIGMVRPIDEVVDERKGEIRSGDPRSTSVVVRGRASRGPAKGPRRRRRAAGSSRALGPERAVEVVDDATIRVECDRVVGALGRDPRVPAVVAAEVPDEPSLCRGRPRGVRTPPWPCVSASV